MCQVFIGKDLSNKRSTNVAARSAEKGTTNQAPPGAGSFCNRISEVKLGKREIGNNILEPGDVWERNSVIALRAFARGRRHFRCADGIPSIGPGHLRGRYRFQRGEQAAQARCVFQAQETGQMVGPLDALEIKSIKINKLAKNPIFIYNILSEFLYI